MKLIIVAVAILGSLTACGSSPSPQAQASSALASGMAAINVPCTSLIGQDVTGKEQGCDGTLIVTAPCLDANLTAHGQLYRGQDKASAFIFGKVGGVWHQGTTTTTQTQMGTVLKCGETLSTGTSTSAAGWSMATAAASYKALIAPINADGQALNASSKSFSIVQAACKKLAADSDTLARGLAAGRWPSQVAAAAKAFETAVTEDFAIFSACAGETSQSAQGADLGKLSSSGAVAKSEQMRIALGLPAS